MCNIGPCNAVFTYEHAASHILWHEQTSRQCILDCACQDFFVGRAGMEAHLVNDCPKVNLICDDCEEVYPR